jgi:hypothetical protein
MLVCCRVKLSLRDLLFGYTFHSLGAIGMETVRFFGGSFVNDVVLNWQACLGLRTLPLVHANPTYLPLLLSRGQQIIIPLLPFGLQQGLQ